MTSQIIAGPDSVRVMLTGMRDVARVARMSLGPSGRGTVIEHVGRLAPIFTKDGRTIAKAIKYQDPGHNVGLKFLTQAAGVLDRQIGDGSNTAIVMTHAMAIEVGRLLATNLSAREICRGMVEARDIALGSLESGVRRVTEHNLKHLALTYANQDESIARLTSEAFESVGQEGDVSAEFGGGVEDELEVVEGARYDKGYASPVFCTNKTQKRVELEHPLFLITDHPITDFQCLVDPLELAVQAGRPLVLIAESVGEEALAALVMNHVRGKIRCAVAGPPMFGETRTDALEDIAILTGGRPFLERQGDVIQAVKLADLGQADKVVMDAESTTIIGGRGCPQNKRARIATVLGRRLALHSETRSMTGRVDLEEKLADRLRMLSEKSAKLRVGGANDTQIRYRLRVAEKAIGATRAALESGVVAGGGAAYFRAAQEIEMRLAGEENLARRAGLRAVALALKAPRTAILASVGEGSLASQPNEDVWFGWDVRSRRDDVDLWEARIADPLNQCRLTLSVAVSLCESLCNVSVMVLKTLPEIDDFSPEMAAATREVM